VTEPSATPSADPGAAPRLRLLAVLAHPDDESLGLGGTIAKYVAEGVEVYLATATRGERGRFFDNENRPSDDEVGEVREQELRAAAAELGIREVALLGYRDQEVDAAPPAEAIGRIAALIRRWKPQVVVTFDPYGAYGHPDHVAICQFTSAALSAAADPSYLAPASDAPPHRADKLYYVVSDQRAWGAYQTVFKKLVSRVDGQEREAIPWPSWAITTRLDTHEHWPTAWRAVQHHRTQLAIYQQLSELEPHDHEALWGWPTFYRVASLVNGGREIETDLFEGLR
jgi:LmbE family N-acetylglucosaminyl deacetylase